MNKLILVRHSESKVAVGTDVSDWHNVLQSKVRTSCCLAPRQRPARRLRLRLIALGSLWPSLRDYISTRESLFHMRVRRISGTP